MPASREVVCLVIALGVLAGCAGPSKHDRAPKRPPDVSNIPDAVPRAEPRSKSGNPPFYEVFGERYYVKQTAKGHVEKGVASWYGEKFHGRRTSSGETYDMYAMTAAHKTLPLPTYARVTNLKNGRSVVVKINDRGPFIDNRIVDLSYSAAKRLDMITQGTAFVELETIDPGERATPVRASSKPAPTRPASPPPVAQAPRVTLAGGTRSRDDMYVQAGAFGQSDNADALADKIRNNGIDGVVVQKDVSGGRTLYRVRVGPVTGVDHYDWMVARMTELGIKDAYLAVD
ncbi:MAG: septal ring lytic transglycosylase RlpA family protein [Gammaproteobacteria bacterium]